jgi:hypothetical protein
VLFFSRLVSVDCYFKCRCEKHFESTHGHIFFEKNKQTCFYPRIAATVRKVLLVKQFGSNRARYASSYISIHNCTFVSVRDVSFKVAGLWGQVPVDQILTGLLMGFEPPRGTKSRKSFLFYQLPFVRFSF